MSILDGAAFLTVYITEVVNSLTSAESRQRSNAAPWGYTSMVNLVASRRIEQNIGRIIVSFFLIMIAAITIKFLLNTRRLGHMLFYLRDGSFMVSVRIWRQRKNGLSRLLYWLDHLWCCLSYINFLNSKADWSSLSETDGQRLLRNEVFRFGACINSCIIEAILASEGTFSSAISRSWPQKWRVREDTSISREWHSCLFHIDRNRFFRIID